MDQDTRRPDKANPCNQSCSKQIKTTKKIRISNKKLQK
ncbi:hypothetical protein CSB93_0540 [Pseudomonas paraeruginosa]|uniref:Uncharacterized protein n=1 Tax=Pseudomonas paraeruginosa TaxID=2994495 RepID=A0A2R3IMA5_9PSED|nr:hypothetical protein CSB93_0540 [Pseudomonas paraeruginosa]AWE94372.1 hypothetical protein CSC28_5853 [Pseudomonas paraeruginosa]PTC34174.1 hypothetical protein CLJ1_5382 [Pseudomonas aeruginosa]